MANVAQPSAPQGYQRSNGGSLYIPSHYAGDNLNANNNELLQLKERLDTKSLECSIVDAYLSASKVKDAKGVDHYNKEVTADGLADIVMKQVSYHIHKRHFESLPENLFSQLENVKDINGESYTGIIVSALSGANKESLIKLLEDNIINFGMVSNLASRITGGYLQRQVSQKLQHIYQGDIPEMKKGLTNLGEVFRLDPSVFRIKDLPTMGEEKVMENYMKGLFTSWNNIERPQEQ